MFFRKEKYGANDVLAHLFGAYFSVEITIVISLNEHRDTEQGMLAMCDVRDEKTKRNLSLSEYRDTEQAVLAMCAIERVKDKE